MNALAEKKSKIEITDMTALCQEIKTRACTGEFDDQGYVSQDIIEKLKEVGIYRALVPARFGGDECSPRQF